MSMKNDNSNDGKGHTAADAVIKLLLAPETKDATVATVRQLSGLTEDTIKLLRKTVQTALYGIDFGAELTSRAIRFIKKSFDKVPEQKRIAPPPQILGPVLEGIRYEPEDTIIDEMFAELLARSVDEDRISEAHPAYAYIIKQLSHDEAVILVELRTSTYRRQSVSHLDKEINMFRHASVEFDNFPAEKLYFPENVDFHIHHLHLLGLAGLYEYKSQEPVRDDQNVQVGTRIFSEYRLTSFGSRFVKACCPENTKQQ